jgi:putative spermidine/putrescine transport system substrate-binding protein
MATLGAALTAPGASLPAVSLSSGVAAAAQASPAEIVFATWGGVEIKNLTRAFTTPFQNAGGANVVFDGTGPTEGAIRNMVDSGDVSWDICDADGYSAIRLGRAGALSAMDYTIIDRAAVIPPFTFDHGVGGYTYAYVLAYDTEVYKDHPPQNWQDFWDVRRFPGNRGLWRWMNGGFEAAMLAAGAAREKVFPINMNVVMDRLRQLKPNLVPWDNGAQSTQMLVDKTVSMSCIWHSRAAQLAAETKGRIAWTWADSILYPGVWVVPKNNPAGTRAFKLIAFMQEAARQINFTGLQGVGPCNPAATKAMPASLRPIDPTQPEARAQMVTVDSLWWADNYDLAMKRFQDLLDQA